MSAHFIPITLHTADGEDAWFSGINGYWAGIRGWNALVATLDQNTDLYIALKEADGWVHPESIKELADLIRDIDTSTMVIPYYLDYLPGVPHETQDKWVRQCAARLKEVIMECAKNGRGLLHFH